jgi:hypothetical protein
VLRGHPSGQKCRELVRKNGTVRTREYELEFFLFKATKLPDTMFSACVIMDFIQEVLFS